ncbi:MAG: glycosyltransferase family 4 protein [Spirochaetales bacterium]|nr:glycosyltransferase family 4 protein [Spirochaetales bacterium]
MERKNIGFISFRISGTDGVSLETKKWAEIFDRFGFKSFYMAGELDTDPDVSFTVEESHFRHPEALRLYKQSFNGGNKRPRQLSKDIHAFRDLLKDRIYEFIEKFDLDMLVPQNTLTIPLNISLAMALTEVIAETNIPVIAHHHDFFWERKRFLRNCVWDYLGANYPPHLNSISHVVINSSARHQLGLRTGISSTLIPNVMHFEKEVPAIDDFNADVRKVFGIDEDELFVLQPTRVVQRKGIEHAIELVARLKRKAVLVISHASGDEGYEYEQRVKEFAELLKIRALFVSESIADERGFKENGDKIYSLQDVYPHADLVTYPSLQEGFGNAFLEAVYFRKPILVNNYSIYAYDIKPKGFEAIEMDDFISQSTVDATNELLDNPEKIKAITDLNYELSLKHYSFTVLENKLRNIVEDIWGRDPKPCE